MFVSKGLINKKFGCSTIREFWDSVQLFTENRDKDLEFVYLGVVFGEGIRLGIGEVGVCGQFIWSTIAGFSDSTMVWLEEQVKCKKDKSKQKEYDELIVELCFTFIVFDPTDTSQPELAIFLTRAGSTKITFLQ